MLRDQKTNKIVLTALMMCLVIVATMFVKLPIPFTQGYVHLGDAMIFLSVLILGRKYSVIAAGLGSALGDILGGFAIWAPWTMVIKGLMAFIMATFILYAEKKNGKGTEMKNGKASKSVRVTLIEVIGMIFAGIEMVIGYYAAEGFIYGNWTAPMLGVPWNIGQFAVGMVIATVLAAALCKTPAKKFFAIEK